MQLESVCGDNVRFGLVASNARNIKIVKFLTKENVEIKIWPNKVLQKLHKAWLSVASEEAGLNKDFAKVFQSIKNFSEEYQILLELSEL